MELCVSKALYMRDLDNGTTAQAVPWRAATHDVYLTGHFTVHCIRFRYSTTEEKLLASIHATWALTVLLKTRGAYERLPDEEPKIGILLPFVS